jgi:hypothetical protein
MSATAFRSSHPWAATHRLLLVVVTVALAVAATVVIVLMTSGGSSPSSVVRAPHQGQTVPQNPLPKPAQPDMPRNCLVSC